MNNRQDEFVSRDASPIEGYPETKGLLFESGRIHVSVIGDWGRCQIELLDGKADSLSGKPVQPGFHLLNTQLFSFWMD